MSEELKQFTVVNNDEGQYSIWLRNKEVPLGWRESGKVGSKEECLNYIKEVWTDMRPVSLRKAMGD
jgi:MbtH protein